MARVALSLLAFSLCACATSGDASRYGSRNVITAEEIRTVQALNAYEAVERLRPAFVRRSSVNMSDDTRSYAIVYLDNLRLGGIEELRRIRTSDVQRIEYLNASDATLRFGTGHTGGALLVTTRRPSQP